VGGFWCLGGWGGGGVGGGGGFVRDTPPSARGPVPEMIYFVPTNKGPSLGRTERAAVRDGGPGRKGIRRRR